MTDVADLGELGPRVLLFGGPYSNLQATGALIAAAARLDIPATRWICTGDVCAYCADPSATTRVIRETGCAVVRGNCEESLGNRLDDCGCGFEEGAACDLLAGQWYAHADAALDDEARSWMRTRPAHIIFRMAGRRYVALHGGAEVINRFMWPSLPDAAFADEIALLEARFGPLDGVIAGHTGIPFERRIGSCHWINAGAIGLPAHDGDPRTHFAVLEEGSVTFHRLAYDHEAAAQAMREAGLRAGYDRALLTGWWPSEGSFPAEMRRGRVA